MAQQQAIVRVPASTANLGPGFDCLGMALELYAWIEMRVAERTTFELHGANLQGIAEDKSNLVYRIAQQVFDRVGYRCPELAISMYSDIPLTRGLGSSASAIVGALVAANELSGNRMSGDELFHIAAALEQHPDNVGASLYGGIIAATWDGERANYIRIEPDERLEVLVATPAFQLSTEKARHVLPQQVAMKDAVYNLSHSSLLVAALCTGNLPMIKHAMKDALHQPYRAALIPGMQRILREADRHGALGIALSGAGPTMLALVERNSGKKRELEKFLQDTLAGEGIEAETMWLKPAREGAQLLTRFDNRCTFLEKIQGEIRV